MDLNELNEVKNKLDEMKCSTYDLEIEFDDKTKIKLTKPKDEKDNKIGFTG